ncbi:nickel-dependent lactate racemase [candidate division KSB1 bacterium]|nr:MAG: nickel-dependent lactate racemase [candidate division KSB1 bacterium]
MKIKIDYGKKGLVIDVPDKNLSKILSMRNTRPVDNPEKEIEKSLEMPVSSPPLRLLAKGKSNAVILISDITRPVPNRILLPPILKTLENSGIKRENITILIATGIHRPNLGKELISMVGEFIYKNYKILNHYSKKNDELTFIGNTISGIPVYINSTYLNSELKIATGFIEPHLMAGYSGGRKSICPGICGLETVKYVHGPEILEHPDCREGILDGNPYHKEAENIMKMAGLDFIVNVSLNEEREITGVFSGEPVEAHKKGAQFVEKHVSSYIKEKVDVVITTNGGYPLDLNLYQCCKGATGALSVVKKGGTIIVTAECSEGLGSPEFAELFRNENNPEIFMNKINNPDFFVVDQWGLEEFIRVIKYADLYIVTDGISKEDKNKSFLDFSDSVDEL